MGRVFQIVLRGKAKILFPQCSEMINFVRGIFLLGGVNLTRNDFDRSENCYLVGGMNLWWGGFFLVGKGGGGMSKFLISGGESPPSPLVGKTLQLVHACRFCHVDPCIIISIFTWLAN